MFKRQKASNEIKEIQKLNEPHDGCQLLRLKDNDLVVDVEGVEKIYTTNSLATKILKGVNLKIYQGEFVVILGPSGSGKTTLMNIMSGLDRATRGKVNILGTNLINLNDDQLTIFRRINIGYIFQQYGLIPNLKVRENIEVGLYLKDRNIKELTKNKEREIKIVDKKIQTIKEDIAQNKLKVSILNHDLVFNDFIRFTSHAIYSDFSIMSLNQEEITENNVWSYSDRYDGLLYFLSYKYIRFALSTDFLLNAIDYYRDTWVSQISARYENEISKDHQSNINDIMETLGISHISNKYPNELSGGQQQRVSIARSFAKNPSILFADEPTGAVDLEMSDIILKAFKDINEKYKTTIIIVTHNPDIASLATKVVYFKDGYIDKIIEQTPQNI